MHVTTLVVLLATALVSTPLAADDTSAPATPAPVLMPDDVRTTHSMPFGDGTLRWQALAGTLPLFEEKTGEVKARIFHVAYTRVNEDGVADADRPILFLFNGGPGSSSVWLHLGAFGPRRVVMGDAGTHMPGPWSLADNEGTLLDVADLVFIDPVTTGFSRATEDHDASTWHGLEADARAVAEFIRLYTARHGRWGSPKFIGGESYGTTRAAAVSRELQDRHGMYLHGVVLVSSILDFGTVRTRSTVDTPWALMLPTYACTAWYHGQVDRDRWPTVDAIAAASFEFARTDYLLALGRGDALATEDRKAMAAQLEAMTGVAADRWLQANLRLGPSRFRKELLRDQGLSVGRLDTRFTGVDADAYGDRPSSDPSYDAIHGPYTAAMNQYLTDELQVHSDLPYEILTGRVHPWDYSSFEGRPVQTATRLRDAMLGNPDLRVYIASGYYDIATPWAATDWTIDHLGLTEAWRAKITTRYFPAGHMMYVRDADRLALSEQVRAFIQAR